MIFDKNWRARFKLKHRANRYNLTDRGLYEIKYMVDKYINCQDIDIIEEYEKKFNCLKIIMVFTISTKDFSRNH